MTVWVNSLQDVGEGLMSIFLWASQLFAQSRAALCILFLGSFEKVGVRLAQKFRPCLLDQHPYRESFHTFSPNEGDLWKYALLRERVYESVSKNKPGPYGILAVT